MNSIFNATQVKKSKKTRSHWSFRKPDGRSKEAREQRNPVLVVKKRGELYSVGSYEPAPIEDVRHYARTRNASALVMGCIKLKF